MTGEETKRKFDNEVKKLDEIGAMHHEFGYKMYAEAVDGVKEIFTVPDWGNIWQFIESEIITPYEKQLEQVERERQSIRQAFLGNDLVMTRNQREVIFKLSQNTQTK